MTVTKADIVSLLAETSGLTTSDVDVIVNGFLYHVMEALQEGDRVELRGFGSFYAKERDARLVKNPRTKKIVPVPHRFCPIFRPAKYFRESVNKSLLASYEAARNE